MAERKDYPICFDGLFRQNIVLTSGLVTAPVIVAATTAERAAILSLSFFMISYFSILICRMIPKKISYTVRIILYAMVAATVFIPTAILVNTLFPETAPTVSLYIEIIVVNSLLLAKTESRFYLITYAAMAVDAFVYIVGYAIVAFAVALIRELLAFGTVFGAHICDALMPAAKSPFFGFFLVGIFAAACRAYYNRKKAAGEKEADVLRKEAEA
ncbi:MAG: NADH:ubiquinone oxidoreductase subunit RnfE [Oscillospiraceae bacterium]|nr:NADH:ubiquinone oxidoreductase subunit RnfE [Oscillospiraceae bacterium]